MTGRFMTTRAMSTAMALDTTVLTVPLGMITTPTVSGEPGQAPFVSRNSGHARGFGAAFRNGRWSERAGLVAVVDFVSDGSGSVAGLARAASRSQFGAGKDHELKLPFFGLRFRFGECFE